MTRERTAAAPTLFKTLCDLLLITLGILTLLVVLLVAQTAESVASSQSASTAANVAAEEAMQAAKQAVAAQLEAKVERERREQAESKLREGTPIELVVLLDVSASMSAAIEELKLALKDLAGLLPRVTRLKIGVIAYREKIVAEFPLTEMVAADKDGGESLRQFSEFLDTLAPVNGYAAVDLAFQRGFGMLDASPDKASRQVLALLADAASGEMNHHQPGDDGRLVNQSRTWLEQPGRDRRGVALYAGLPGAPAEAFFKELGEVDRMTFSDRSAAMLPAIFTAAFSPPEGQTNE